MEKPSQLELFNIQQYQLGGFKDKEYRPKFFGFIRLHEKAISIIIVFFIISLISFSLGVEKGKRLANITKRGRGLLIEQTQPEKDQAEPEKSEAGQILLAGALENKEGVSKYTIQVATFKTMAYAQKEAERLEKNGIKAWIVPRGKFVSVCVGNFSGKQEAGVTLNQLKKKYQDCFIRRL